ncbi:hypothetical protein [Mangrovibacterium diazotrophicum]|uniref:Uncharacterized protein n=1 Tax=Mangrovibacterium diazotrophicum TaxID=1261403 RepID=A0A419W3N2_9BACT|nr:hypothetical protein [Mangrovibacterium diazotrophicum]RKD90049.1 hypothetical protein BC643_0385 [Mangrovibacterium diazotrophicum]
MPTKILEKNQSRVPFLGDRLSFIHGLDPLGLQNPSVQLYGNMLPGLNNVTNRIRYYSFYCWLLGEFARTIRSKNPAEQKQFIRRAEFLVALTAVKAEMQGIPGSSYSYQRMLENPGVFDLKTGTYNKDGSTDKTYWKYSFGIFGQYYVGSLRQMGLIDEPTDENGVFIGIYRRTLQDKQAGISGEELGNAFGENIRPETHALFLNCINEGSVSQQQLDMLLPDFNMLLIDPTTEEWRLLTMLLESSDKPLVEGEDSRSMRRDTIKRFLRFVLENKPERLVQDFTNFAYRKQGYRKGTVDLCMTGWYYYALNEYWQIACTAILNGGLNYLEENVGPGWMALPDFIKKTGEAVLKLLVNLKLAENKEQTVSDMISNIEEGEANLQQLLIREKSIGRIAYSFILVWKLYQTNRLQLDRLMEFTRDGHFVDGEDVLSYFLRFKKFLDYPLGHFIEEFLLVKVIYRHHFVAFRKMGSGNQSTQKFILENNHIRLIDNFSPINTSPRIGSLINFLTDLDFLNHANEVTPRGISLLEKLEAL